MYSPISSFIGLFRRLGEWPVKATWQGLGSNRERFEPTPTLTVNQSAAAMIPPHCWAVSLLELKVLERIRFIPNRLPIKIVSMLFRPIWATSEQH